MMIKNKQLIYTNPNYYRNELLLSKEREIFKNIYNERLDKIEGLTKKITMMIYILLLIVVVMKVILPKQMVLWSFLIILKQAK